MQVSLVLRVADIINYITVRQADPGIQVGVRIHLLDGPNNSHGNPATATFVTPDFCHGDNSPFFSKNTF